MVNSLQQSANLSVGGIDWSFGYRLSRERPHWFFSNWSTEETTQLLIPVGMQDTAAEAYYQMWCYPIRVWTGTHKHSRFFAISLNMSGFQSIYANFQAPGESSIVSHWGKFSFYHAKKQSIDFKNLTRHGPRYATLNWASYSSCSFVRCIRRPDQIRLSVNCCCWFLLSVVLTS